MPPQHNHHSHRQGQQQQPPIVLNVAEKPSVARSLAAVFGRLPGAQDKGMRREVHQIFRHENVCFPSVYQQGHGQLIQGPGKNCIVMMCLLENVIVLINLICLFSTF
jgi:hypothetical protein